jgi:hypothetical protein
MLCPTCGVMAPCRSLRKNGWGPRVSLSIAE